MKIKNFKSTKAITLVALVITIIILLILAGISIATLTGSGLFEKSRLAEQESKNAQEKEEATLGDYENQIEGYLNGNRNTSSYSIVKLGEATGTTPIAIYASKYDELYIETMTSSRGTYCAYNIKTIVLNEEIRHYCGNSTYSSSGRYSLISVSNNQVKIDSIREDNVDYTSTSKIVVYGINY